MMFIRDGSHVQHLLLLLAYVGEYPIKSLHLLGKERPWKALVQKLTKTQEFRLSKTGERFRCKLLTISGERKYRTVSLHTSALVILVKLNPDTYEYYMDHFDGHHFSGNRYHIDRNHRIAEAFAMFLQAGILCWPHQLPDPNSLEVCRNELSQTVFYLSLALKGMWEGEMNKNKFSRMVGAAVCPGMCFVVYNSRDTLMKWSGKGESKVQGCLSVHLCMCLPEMAIKSAILFGEDYLVALRTMEEAKRRRRYDLRFDNVYQHIHFIPLNAFGIKQLQTILFRDWQQAHSEMLYGEDGGHQFSYFCEHDAMIDDVAHVSFLDGNLCKLIRVKDSMNEQRTRKYCITCYPEQVSMLQEYFVEFRGKGRLALQTVTIDQALNWLNEYRSEG